MDTFSSPAELEQWQALRNGDANALGWLYQRHVDTLFLHGMKYNREREVVKDAIQELFIKLWNQRERLSEPRSVIAYLCASLSRMIIQYQQQGKYTANFDELTDNDDIVSPSAEQMLIFDETDAWQLARLNKAFGQLPPRQQQILYLRYHESRTYEEIMEQMGLDYQGVRNLMYKALKAIRVLLAEIIILFLWTRELF